MKLFKLEYGMILNLDDISHIYTREDKFSKNDYGYYTIQITCGELIPISQLDYDRLDAMIEDNT